MMLRKSGRQHEYEPGSDLADDPGLPDAGEQRTHDVSGRHQRGQRGQ